MFYEIKEQANIMMKKYSPNIYIVAFIGLAVPFILNKFEIKVDVPIVYQSGMFQYTFDVLRDIYHSISPIVWLYAAVYSLLSSVFNLLLGYGFTLYYLKASRGHDPQYSDLMAGFYRPGRIIWANVQMAIRIILWSMLFVIPGIIAAISYSQTFRILADDPSLSVSQAIELSTKMMRGNKTRFFLLQLSFIGWSLLGALTWGITTIYSTPYINCAHSIFYDEISYGFAKPLPNSHSGFDSNSYWRDGYDAGNDRDDDLM